jgi:hypothetical protein
VRPAAPSRSWPSPAAASRHASPTRRRAAKLVFVGALLVHGVLLVRAETDPHKLFGFRPFNESDSWRAEVVRVHADGSRIPVDDGTWAYDWDELAGTPKLRNLGRLRHASAGAPASVDFLDRALDWAVGNIPDDPDTVALEATVTVFHNSRGPETIVLRSSRTTE